jgi:hypothetical protein
MKAAKLLNKEADRVARKLGVDAVWCIAFSSRIDQDGNPVVMALAGGRSPMPPKELYEFMLKLGAEPPPT